jgi:hypothetical protein
MCLDPFESPARKQKQKKILFEPKLGKIVTRLKLARAHIHNGSYMVLAIKL